MPRQPYLVEISSRKVKGHFNLKRKIKLGNADSEVAVHMVDGSHRMNEINHRWMSRMRTKMKELWEKLTFKQWAKEVAKEN